METKSLRDYTCRWFIAIIMITGLLFSLNYKMVRAEIPSGFSEYYIPGSEQQLWDIFYNLDNDPALVQSQGMHSVISVVSAADNTKVYYDHWEDGYDFDPAIPTTADETYTLNNGAYKEFISSNIPIPRGAALNVCNNDGVAPATEPCYDGRDRIYVAGGPVTVTRASWVESLGTVQALDWEIYPTKPFLTHYVIPVGEDLANTPKLYDDFNRCYLLVQSTTDNNNVQIDSPRTGGVEVNLTLNKGQVTQLYGIYAGTTVAATYPVQVQFIVGQAQTGVYSESRSYSAVPDSLWSNEYYNPVGGTRLGTANTDLYIYNPNSSAITVSYEDLRGTGSFTINAKDTLSYSDGAGRLVPVNSGVYLHSSSVFWALGSGDTENPNYDHGYSLIPSNVLKDEYYIGWAPGTSDPTPTSNGSPVYVTPVKDSTTVYVDFGPNDGIVDRTYILDRLQVQKIYDPDNNNSGMHVWATGPLALAWAEDPDVADINVPYLDMGYTSLPLPPEWMDVALTLDKFANPQVIPDGAGQRVTFTLVVATHDFPINSVDVFDTLPPNWNYVNDSTVITRPDGSQVSGTAANPSIGGQNLTWDLNQEMSTQQTLTVAFQAQTTSSVIAGYNRNFARASGTRLGGAQVFSPWDDIYVYISKLKFDKTSSAGGSVFPGDTITYTMVVTNAGTAPQANLVISDTLPMGTTYVAQSTTAQGDIWRYVQDKFDTSAFNNNNGSIPWSASWIETDSGGAGPGVGNIQIAGGQLRLHGIATPDQSLARQFDMSGASAAILTFNYSTSAGVDSVDRVVLEISNNGGSTYSTVETIMNITGASTGSRTYDLRDYVTLPFAANMVIRFRVPATRYTDTDEFFYVENLRIEDDLTFRDLFNAQAYNNTNGTQTWATNWSEIGEADGATAGDIQVMTDASNYQLRIQNSSKGAQRQADLSPYSTAILSFDYRRNSLDNINDYVSVQVSNNGGTTWTEIDRFIGPTNDTSYVRASYDISQYIASNTRIRFVASTTSAANDQVYFDNVQIRVPKYRTVTRTNQAAATYPLANGTPPNLVTALDGFNLAPGRTMKVTFKVRVNDAAPAAQSAIVNTASGASRYQPEPLRDTVIDYLPAFIGDHVWLDVDGDGVQDVGEPGIPNVQVRLYKSDNTLVATTYTDANGDYLFPNLRAGKYYVTVSSGVPAGLTVAPGTTNPTGNITLAGTGYLNADFGYINNSSATAIIGDRVWSDGNGNGLQDPGEPGLGGAALALRSAGLDGIFGTGDDVAVATTTTVADGSYLFTGIAPGEYIITVTGGLPGGYTLTGGANPTTPISVTGGQAYLNADFGYQPPASQNNSIGDFIWRDANGNGAQDSGETGLAGVTVALIKDTNNNNVWDAGEPIVATDITDAYGGYLFYGVPDGSYIAWVNDTGATLRGFNQTGDPDQPGVPCTTCDSRSEVDVDPGGANNAAVSITSKDFGYVPRGSIGDTLFSDVDGDGVQDPGEPGIPSVVVQLWRDVDSNGIFDNTIDTLVGNYTTDGSGHYLFTGLPSGTYFSSIDSSQAALSGYTATTSDQETGSKAPGIQIEVNLPVNGAANLNADFGYQKTSLYSIGDLVWNDTDADGTKDSSEIGIPNVTLSLYKDSDGDGILDNGEALLATTTTNAAGSYSFEDLPNGNYLVVVTDKNHVLAGYQQTAGLHPWPVTLNAANRTDIDFGFVRNSITAAIGDKIWYDTDGDGQQDVTEPGIDNVLLNLYRDNGDGLFGSGDTLVTTTRTASDGSYLFKNLSPGIYFVNADSANFNPNQPLAGLVSTTSGNTYGPVALSQNETYLAADLGYRGSANYTIGDFVWSDADDDGIQDPGEAGIGGVTIELLNSVNVVIATTTTRADGSYLFTNLTAGDYKVHVADSNYEPGSVLEDYIVTTGPQSIGSPSTGVITVDASHPSINYIDFGFNKTGLGSIGDYVWLDKDQDGAQDSGEPGITGVTVELVWDQNGDGDWDAGEPIIASTITNGSGNYQFTGLKLDDGGGDGDFDYLIAVNDTAQELAGMTPTNGTSNPRPVTLTTANTVVTNADFGYDDPILGDYVWHDANQNGIQETGETGIQGVVVLLYHDTNGNGVIDPGQDDLLKTTTTDSNGYYYFGGLPFQNYIIKLADSNFSSGSVLSGFTSSLQDQGSNDALDSDSNANHEIRITPLTVKNFTLDFGLMATTGYTIGNQLWDDIDGDGFHSGGESGISGVTINLFRDLDGDGVIDQGDPLIGKTTTDDSGVYTFSNIPAGNYIVQVADQTGRLLDYLWTDGALDNTNDYSQLPTYPLSVTSNINYADSGYYKPSVPTAVTLGSFFAVPSMVQISLTWQTMFEFNIVGFNIYRSTSLDGERLQLNTDIIPGQGLGLPGRYAYQFVDSNIETGVTYYYWLEIINVDGNTFYGPLQTQLPPFVTFIPLVIR